MRKVLVTFAGGRAVIGICKALRAGAEPPHIIGVDSDKYSVQRVLSDEHYLVPRGDHPLYIPALKRIIERTGAELLWPVHEAEIAAVVSHADDLPVRTFLPDAATIARGQDKQLSFELSRPPG